MMVEEILNIIGEKLTKKSIKEATDCLLIDLGTGTGAIIISAANEIKRIFPAQYGKIIFRAIDISFPALNIAKKNAILNKQDKKIKFLQGNLLEPLINKNDFNKLIKNKLIIAANLPYLTLAQIKISPSIQKEPKIALAAGQDGLKYYRKLFKQLKEIKSVFDFDSNHKPITLLCEIDPSQNKNLKLLAKKYFPSARIEIKKDLANKNRLAIIKILD